jgi:type I restriction enzyme R subunit
MNGIFLDEGEQVGVVDPVTGAEQLDLLEDERHFEAPEVERRVTSPDSNRRIVEEIKKYAVEHERETGRFPKTLIFAANDLPHVSHADQLVDTCRDAFGMGDAFVAKITGRVDRPLQRIREFRNRPQPAIVVSVDLMSTGVDIPDLEFIVFLRQVQSRILFEQMVGRGTRKGDRFPDKSHFVVFDCFDGTLVEYFRKATAITAEPPERAARTIVEIIEDIWSNRDREYNIRCLVKRLQRIDKQMSAEARQLFAAYVPAGDVARFAREVPRDLREDFVGTMKLLRDKGFQDLLENYPRARTGFVVAYEDEDKVSSEWRIKGADGEQLKPEDYLAAFARFVRENPEHIAAIQILLDRPAAWGTDALDELRIKLAGARERFDEATLRRAHQVQYHKALVDIISMVKHAASEESPLLTAEERVERAMRTLREGREFSHEQRLWLARIQAHLVENLSIDPGDFDAIPVFEREGGWVRANRVFDGRLGELLHALNGAIAA